MQGQSDQSSVFIENVDLITSKGKGLKRIYEHFGFVFQGFHLQLQKKVK